MLGKFPHNFRIAFLAACGLLTAAIIHAQVVPGPGGSGGPTSVIVGQVQTATGGAINYGALTFSLSQPAVVAGSATIATETSACYTSAQGNIVGVPDAAATPVLSVNLSSGSLSAGTYYVVIYYIGAGGVGAVSPEASINLSNEGSVLVNAPGVQPNSASGYGVAISTVSGGETIQASVNGWAQYTQSAGLVTGATPQALNTSFCSVYLSDQLIPTGTYYTVNLVNKNGSQISGFPQSWCMYGGAGATINVSNGAPTGNCSTSGVFYPTPVFTNPPNTLVQSIASGLNLGGGLTVGGNSTLNGNLGIPHGTFNVSGNSTFSAAANFSSTVNLTTPGVFTSSQYNLYMESLIGGVNPATEVTPAFTAAMTGALLTPAGATVLNSFGVVGIGDSVCNSSGRTVCNTGGGYFQGRADANGAAAWGLNQLVNDNVGISTYLTGDEIDVNVLGTPTVVYGLQISGLISGTMPANSDAVYVDPIGGAFENGINFTDGSITATAYWVPALAASGNSINSASIGWDFFDSTGTEHSEAQLVDFYGLMEIAQGVKVNPGIAPTCAFTSGGGTSPGCTLDTGSSNQNGIIILAVGSGSPAGTGTVTLTFGNYSGGFGPHKPVCQYQASDGGAGTWNGLAVMKDKTPTNTTDLFTWTNGSSPTALTASTAYWITYQCWAK